jgi:hypothetical protein
MASALQLTLQEWLYFCGARDETGAPVASGFAYFYEPGSTSVAITVYSDTEGTPLDQPVPLDAAGRAEVYAADEYECIVKDSTGATKRIAVRAGQTAATAVDTVFRSSDAKLQDVLDTIGAELDALNAAAATAVPASTVNVVTVSTATPSFAFDKSKQTNVFVLTYAGAVGTGAITWSTAPATLYSQYRIIIQTGGSTTATDVTLPVGIYGTFPGAMAAGAHRSALFQANATGALVQITAWETASGVYW